MADREETVRGGVSQVRTVEDLRRTVRAIASHFNRDEVVIPADAGTSSQAILVSHPGAPAGVRFSREIDTYPANAKAWQAAHDVEASEEINALFGYRSQFDRTHGFYIDGVDEKTAMLPPDWRSRAAVRSEDVDGRRVRVRPAAEEAEQRAAIDAAERAIDDVDARILAHGTAYRLAVRRGLAARLGRDGAEARAKRERARARCDRDVER